MLTKGDVVMHPKYGLGTILRFRNRRFDAWVTFGRFRLWLRVRELQGMGKSIGLVGSNARSSASVSHNNQLMHSGVRLKKPSMSFSIKKDTQKMQILESLRTGLVPKSEIADWTFGRDAEVQAVKNWLNDLSEGALLIEGGYGMGKSHLLAYLEHMAWKENFAVAFTGYDPSEATAAFPKRFYRNLISTFSLWFDGRMLGFRDFIHELLEKGAIDFFKDQPYLYKFMKALQDGSVDEADWEWLEGRDTYSKNYGFLYDHRTAANIYCNILSALSAASVEFMGLQGLLILVDEAEVIRTQRYRYQVEGAMNLMRGLAMVSNDDPVFLDETIARNGSYRGTESGLLYSGFMPNMRYIYRIPTYLKIAYALTPSEIPGFHRMRAQMPVIKLSPLKRKDVKALFNQLVVTYKGVYDLSLDKKWQTNLFNRSVELFDPNYLPLRMLVKALVEAMDILRFYPTIRMEEIFDSNT